MLTHSEVTDIRSFIIKQGHNPKSWILYKGKYVLLHYRICRLMDVCMEVYGSGGVNYWLSKVDLDNFFMEDDKINF
jgi:hypothetical protein